MKYKCFIVDDEPPATRIIESYLSKLDSAELVGKASNALEALEFLQKNPVDILFLDINLPEVSGMNLLKILDHPPAVVLTTAYSEYAVESYDYNVVDYLLKPIRLERFIIAFEKAKRECHRVMRPVVTEQPEHFEFRTNDGTKKIPFKEIRYLQSLGNYIKVFAGDRSYITLLSTKEAESALPRNVFVRIHKSFIVNINFVNSSSNETVSVGGMQLPIGKTYKRYFTEHRENQIQ